MKIKISTIVDVPDNYLIPECKYGSAVQFLFDIITHYVTRKHAEDALTWLGEGRKHISDFHTEWREKCGQLKWDYEEVP